MSSKVFAILLLVVPAVLSHLCIMSPVQRGGFNVNTPGENACYLKVGPCGGIASGDPVATLTGGQSFNIKFQQNLNHFYIEKPGTLTADIALVADPQESDFQPLASINDYNAMNEITQTNFTLPVNIPNVNSDHAVLRMRYISENPTENDRGTTFYQCADVKIAASTSAKMEEEVNNKQSQPNKGSADGYYDCCAPSAFTIQGFEQSSWRNPTKKHYYFDAVNKLFRVDANSGSGVTEKDGHFQMYSNFTSGIEYYYNVHANTCGLFGLNYWSDWCYGAVNNQKHEASIRVGNEVADTWTMPGTNDIFRWVNVRSGCVPLSMSRQDTGESTFFINFDKKAPDSSVFQLPSACIRAEAELGAKKLVQTKHTHMTL